MKLTNTKFDKFSLMVNGIDDPMVKYASMMIGYKIFYKNRENLVSTTVIHTTHQMVKEGLDFDLCEISRLQLMENLQKKK